MKLHVRPGRAAAALLALFGLGGNTWAQTPDIFRDADLALGEKLVLEHKCSACHARKVGGDGSAIYRPTGRINSPSLLRGMVDYCSTELNLQLFPEDVTAVAAVLQRDHYRFGMSAAPAAKGARP
jgi:mono/diheme cytochrome c family protein